MQAGEGKISNLFYSVRSRAIVYRFWDILFKNAKGDLPIFDRIEWSKTTSSRFCPFMEKEGREFYHWSIKMFFCSLMVVV
jgi:hypothetical protein